MTEMSGVLARAFNDVIVWLYLPYTLIAEFWQTTSSYWEQPIVNFLNRLYIQTSGTDGSSSTWTSYPNWNALLEGDELATPVLQVSAPWLVRGQRLIVVYAVQVEG